MTFRQTFLHCLVKNTGYAAIVAAWLIGNEIGMHLIGIGK